MPEIVISIINYKTADMTLACVRSVLDDLHGIDAEIVIVDNASGDGSVDVIDRWIKDEAPSTPVHLVQSATNSGFSGGHNQGISTVKAEFYLILNSDALIHTGFFDALLKAAKAAPKAGLTSPSILSGAGTPEVGSFRFHSPLSEFLRGAQTGPITKLLSRHVVALQPPVNPKVVEWVSFACVLLRADMIAQIGPMDEGYFLYFEDSEYCLRARRAGWDITHAPDAKVMHYEGGSGDVVAAKTGRRKLPAYYYASRSRFLYQAHGRIGLWGANLLWSLGRVIAQTRRLFGKPVPAAADAEYKDIWINAMRPLGPRRAPGD